MVLARPFEDDPARRDPAEPPFQPGDTLFDQFACDWADIEPLRIDLDGSLHGAS
jgi:hypothetical protein